MAVNITRKVRYGSSVTVVTGAIIWALVGYVPALEPYAQLPSWGRVDHARNTFEVGLFWGDLDE